MTCSLFAQAVTEQEEVFVAVLDAKSTTTSRDIVDKRTPLGNRDSKRQHAARWFGDYLTLCRQPRDGKGP